MTSTILLTKCCVRHNHKRTRLAASRHPELADTAGEPAGEGAVPKHGLAAVGRPVARPPPADLRQPLLQRSLPAAPRHEQVAVRHREGATRRAVRPAARHPLRVQGAHGEGRERERVLRPRHQQNFRER